MAAKPGAETPTMIGTLARLMMRRAIAIDSAWSSLGASPSWPRMVMPSIPQPRKKSVMRSSDVSSTRPSSWKGVGAIGITPLMLLVRTTMLLPWCAQDGSDAGDQASVDADHRPGHVGGALARQERDHVGVFLRLAVTPERDRAGALGSHLRDRTVLALGLGLVEEQDALRRDPARQHDVGRDAVASDLARQRLRPTDEGEPQRVRDAEVRDRRHNARRRAGDDAPPFALAHARQDAV